MYVGRGLPRPTVGRYGEFLLISAQKLLRDFYASLV
jgi:hypothetical protein